ncbi:MAG: serine/threonine-protein kinase [Planctomycetota bacterium]|nr:serine/threonine-protein kinase [Planctomycetota bacterium]
MASGRGESTVDVAAQRAAALYTSRRASGASVTLEELIPGTPGSPEFEATRTRAMAFIADDPATQADVRPDARTIADVGPGAPGPDARSTRATAGGIADRATRLESANTIGPGGDGAALPAIEGYEVRSCLGRGGMGAVFEAVQLSTGRRVAVKLMIDAAGVSDAARQRFEREVEVVARLEHPGIVSVVDSGVRKGRYYYVMEYVPGDALDRALPPGKGDVRRVVEMLVEICEAVDYAHQRGVLHRDLKPSNVIVDKRGRPRLLDFGIAKLVDDKTDERHGQRGMTIGQPGQLLGTVAYMSPEQAQARNDLTSVRTDVYALGAIGYELLTGHLPCSAEGSLREVLARIAEVDPAPPSKLRRAVPRDIDAVLLRALEKDPQRRYATAGELAQDLSRWLRGEPVSARRVGPTGRFWRFVKRNRTVSMAAAIAAVVLCSVSTLLIIRIVDERDRAVANFALLRGVLESADPERSNSIVQLLDNATKKIEESPPGVDLAEADVRAILGVVYRKFGEYGKARAQQQRVLEIYDARDEHDTDARAEAIHNLAATLWWEGSYSQAETLYTRSLNMRRRLHRGDHPDVAMSLTHLAACRLRMGRLPEATQLYAEALDMRQRLYKGPHEEVAQALNNVAKCELDAEAFERAEVLFRRALDMIVSLRGEQYAGTAAASQNLGDCLLRRCDAALVQGDGAGARTFAEQADEAFSRALAIRLQMFPRGHHLVAMSRAGQARAKAAHGAASDAREAATQALAMIRQTRPANHPDIVDVLDANAEAHLAAGDVAGALDFLDQALAISGSVEPRRAEIVARRGVLLVRLGRTSEGEQALAEGLAALRQARGTTSVRVTRLEQLAHEAGAPTN